MPTLTKIALIGFRATGKSLLGALTAQQLDWTFMDMDERLTASLGQDIRTWVETHGWESFRDAEARLLRTLIHQERLVLATGGGVILRPSNRELLKRHFLCLWLRGSPETLYTRLMQDPKTASMRPSLGHGTLYEEIEQALLERTPLYEAMADYTLETDLLPPSALTSAIMTIVQRDPRMS